MFLQANKVKRRGEKALGEGEGVGWGELKLSAENWNDLIPKACL